MWREYSIYPSPSLSKQAIIDIGSSAKVILMLGKAKDVNGVFGRLELLDGCEVLISLSFRKREEAEKRSGTERVHDHKVVKCDGGDNNRDHYHANHDIQNKFSYIRHILSSFKLYLNHDNRYAFIVFHVFGVKTIADSRGVRSG